MYECGILGSLYKPECLKDIFPLSSLTITSLFQSSYLWSIMTWMGPNLLSCFHLVFNWDLNAVSYKDFWHQKCKSWLFSTSSIRSFIIKEDTADCSAKSLRCSVKPGVNQSSSTNNEFRRPSHSEKALPSLGNVNDSFFFLIEYRLHLHCQW